MIVSQQDYNLIVNSRIRKRVLKLPVRHGSFSELKRCPVRRGGLYRITTAVPYARYRVEAEKQSSRARSVLWLIDRCLDVRPSTLVTVIEDPERQDDVWLVRFVIGDERDYVLDRSRYLIRRSGREGDTDGDYTHSRLRAMRDEPPAVPKDWEIINSAEATSRAAERERARARSEWLQERAVLERSISRLQASDLGTDVAKNLRVLKLQLKAIDAKLDPNAGIGPFINRISRAIGPTIMAVVPTQIIVHAVYDEFNVPHDASVVPLARDRRCFVVIADAVTQASNGCRINDLVVHPACPDVERIQAILLPCLAFGSPSVR